MPAALQHCSTAALSSRCANFPSCNWICQPMLTRWQSPRNMDMMIMLSIDSRASYWQVSQWTVFIWSQNIRFYLELFETIKLWAWQIAESGVLIIVTAGHMRQYEARELRIIQMMMSCVGTQTWTWWTVMESVVSCQYKQRVQLWMN